MFSVENIHKEVSSLIEESRRKSHVSQCDVKDTVKRLIPDMRVLNSAIKDSEFTKRKLYLCTLIAQMNILASRVLVDGLGYLEQKSTIFSRYRKNDFKSPFSIYVSIDQILDDIEVDINLPLIEKTKQSVRKFYDLIAELWFGTFEMDYTELLLHVGHACSYNGMCINTYPIITKYTEYLNMWRKEC